jgi:hypothetical protein
MFRIVFLWLFVMATLGDVVLVVLKCLDVLSLSWWVLAAIPFAVAIGGTIVFALFYLLIKIFVNLII